MAQGALSAEKRSVGMRVPVLPVRDTVHFPGVIQTLLVGRDMSLRALQESLDQGRETLVLSQRDHTIDEPAVRDLYRVGTLSEVLHVLPLPDGTMRVVLRGLARARATKLNFRAGHFSCSFSFLLEEEAASEQMDALMRECVSAFQQASNLGMQVGRAAIGCGVVSVSGPG